MGEKAWKDEGSWTITYWIFVDDFKYFTKSWVADLDTYMDSWALSLVDSLRLYLFSKLSILLTQLLRWVKKISKVQ